MKLESFCLDGYRLESAQIWGSVWLVPIVRTQESRGDLRLQEVKQEQSTARSTYDKADFFSYMPSAYVLDWSEDGSAVATNTVKIRNKGTTTNGRLWKRTGKSQLGFLPQSLAIEGFLVQHFGGPRIGWLDYHRDVRRGNLGTRAELALPGWLLKGVSEAVRIFEFAPQQVGSALFVDGKLINCFICPHPCDYANLHRSLLVDLYPFYLIHYGYLREGKPEFRMDPDRIKDIATLRQEFERVREQKMAQETLRLDAILNRPLNSKSLYRAGPFSVQRFYAELDPEGDNYCGEAIVRDNGQIEYVKLYHLSRAEMRRLLLLKTVSEHNWNFDQAAPQLHAKNAEGVARMFVGADLAYLLNPGVWGHLLRGGFT